MLKKNSKYIVPQITMEMIRPQLNVHQQDHRTARVMLQPL